MTTLSTLLLPLLSAVPGADPHADASSPAAAVAFPPRLVASAAQEEDGDVPVDWLDPSRALTDLVGDEVLGLDALHVDLLLRGVYSSLDEDVEDELGTDDFLDFQLIDADVALSGFAGAWSGRVSVDLSGEGPDEDGPSLEDAFLRWSDRWWGDVTVGRFKPNVLRSSEADPEHLLFPTRTFLGTAFDRWDEGVEWHGTYDEFDWWLSGTNREDGFADENLYVGRGEWSLYDAWWAPQEGARNAPVHLQVVFGAVAVVDDGDEGDNDAIGLDLQWRMGPWSFAGEWMDLDSMSRLTPSEEADLPFASQSDASPWSLTLGRMFGEEFQAGFRVQDADDFSSTKAYSLGLNWFPFDAPVALLSEATHLDRDSEDGILLRIGFSFGGTRHDEPVVER